MSWMKRAQGGAAPPPGAERQAYAAPQAQPFGNQQNMYSNFQGGTTGNVPPQQFWQMPPQQQPQYNQQYGQVYQQQDYPANANQFYQQPNPNQFNQTYTSQGFNSTQQQSYQQGYYQNQGAQQQNFQQNKANADSWEDNWDWGWEESAKQAQKASQNAIQQPNPTQQQAFNNANVIAESFASTDSWNWSMDDKKESKEIPTVPHMNENKEPPAVAESKPAVDNNVVPDSNVAVSASHISAQATEEVRTLNDREVVKERLPNLAIGKRFHLDNLTPQWSIESQMSQESSDGPHTQSEGTYRSENQSRNSSKSSPGLNTENSNFNYSQAGLDEGFPQNSEWSRPSEEPTLTDSIQTNSLQETHEELSGPMQEMNLNNHENPSKEALHPINEVVARSSQDTLPTTQPPPALSPNNFPAPAPSNVLPPSISSTMPPPPPVSSMSLPVTSSPVALSAPPSSSAVPPPNIPPPTTNQNPFKMNGGPFSHKTISKVSTSATTVQAFPPPMSSANLTSPAVVSKVSQNNRVPLGFEANLETTPDNSERPDQLQVSAFRPMPVSQQVPDNMEVAPRNDRNEYLQTAHLSTSDYGENTDFSRGAPPPGLRRMVVGQQESEYNQNLNISGDEPPPGLARMVPGQQTEAENAYSQSADNYLDRHIDGQPTDGGARPYRQADGQQTPDNYTQPAPPSRVTERRPIGLDRMVPGEPSNDEYSQYQGSNYAANEHRVVTGLDHDFSMPSDSGPPDVREQNVDGSDYTEQSTRNPSRNIIGARESSNDASPDFNAPPDEQQREIIMEGENLQDLSIISSTELTYSREQVLDGADITLTDIATDRKTDLSDSIDHPTTSSRRQSLNRVNTSGEDSERDRAFKSSPRREHKSTRDRDQKRDRDRDRERDRERDKDGRYSRGDRKYEADRRSVREDRRAEKDRRERDGYARDRRERDASPDLRRQRRAARAHRYETEDTDYYSDRERDRRRHREGSYTSSKPPRPDDKERRYGEERDRSKRYHTIERERRYDDERERRERRRGERHRERYERAYRDIDPTRTYGNLRAPRGNDDPRRVVTFSSDAKANDSCMKQGELSSPSRPQSRDAAVTDDDAADARRRPDRADRRARRTADPFYDEYGAYADPYLAQRQQYQYYEQLRLRDPAAYMLVYKQLLAGHAPPVPPVPSAAPAYDAFGDFGSLGYEARREERGSVHSGRSSTTGLKGNDTYCLPRRDLRDAPSPHAPHAPHAPHDAHDLRADLSDRELNTDMSLNLHLEESTVRSERMTPFRYSTAHIKGSVGVRDVVVVRAAYPVDGAPATVHVLSLAAALAHLPAAGELAAFPGPLAKGVTHKKSVIDYCEMRVRNAEKEGSRDVTGYVLLWELLALMLRQNGVVVGTDIAELLMKNAREYEYKVPAAKSRNESRRGSSVSGEGREAREEELRSSSPDQPSLSMSENLNQESLSSPGQAVDERAALDRLRELLIYGNRQDAIEWAMSSGLWGHAMQLAAHAARRVRAGVAARFLAAQPRADPLHTLYAALSAAPPPAATCVADERWGDWRPHAAMILSNPSARPDQDRRTLTQLGDSLASRGLLYSAQVCYVSAGARPERHPLAPLRAPGAAAAPRLALLLADPRAATLDQLAHNKALFATEVYEYALSLNQDDFVFTELQPYKFLLSCRLLDCGLYERALAYTEACARAVTRNPAAYSPALLANLATLADRLKYHDPALAAEGALAEDADSAEGSPRHQQWLDDVKHAADIVTEQAASQQTTPQHLYQQQQIQQQQYAWNEQQAQQYPPPPQAQAEPPSEETPDYAAQYYSQQQQLPQQVQQQQQPEESQQYGGYEEWGREEPAQQYADPYWQPDQGYSYTDGGATGEGGTEDTPTITMPGASKPRAPYYADYDDAPQDNHQQQQSERDTDSPKSGNTKKQEAKPKDEGKDGKGKGSGWLGGILTKLSLRPPNQMILPDDKNPTIVWDAEHKRWRNLDGDGEQAEQPPPPPPTAAQLPPALRSASPPLAAPPGAPPGAPPAAPVSNIFKMQKGRHIKKSYVDVFNPSGAATRPLPPAGEVLGPPAPLAAPANYFVPAPLPAFEPSKQEPEVIRPETIEVMIPPSPTPSNSESPPPSPIPDPDPDESGVYEPSMVESEQEAYERSGI